MNSAEKRSKVSLDLVSRFADPVSLLRIRNASKRLRRIAKLTLKNKKVRLPYYNQKALVLNGLVYLGKNNAGVDCPEEMMPGVADYLILSKFGVERLRAVCPQMHCTLMVIYSFDPVQFGNVSVLEVKQHNFMLYRDLSFKQVDCLKIKNLSLAQTSDILAKIEVLKELVAEKSEICFISPGLKLRSMTLIDCTVARRNVLYYLKELTVKDSTGLCLLHCPYLVKLAFESPPTEIIKNWLFSLKKLKIAQNIDKVVCLNKHLRYFHNYFLKTELKIVKWGNLVCLDCPLSRVNASSIDSTELKIVNSEILNDWSGRLNSRLRRVGITAGNIEFFCKHPELLFKCSDLWSNCLQTEDLREKLQNLLQKVFESSRKTVIRSEWNYFEV